MSLRHELFMDPQFGGAGITFSWIERARDIHRNSDRTKTEFERFSALWQAFNAWGFCVTLAETDVGMIRALSADRAVEEVFRTIIDNTNLRDAFAGIEHNFPLPSFSDLLRLDPLFNWRGDRDEIYWEKIRNAPSKQRVRLSPPMDHRNLIWSDVLACTYKVRCNLAHGGKMFNRQEAMFVGVFSDLLHALLTCKVANVLILK